MAVIRFYSSDHTVTKNLPGSVFIENYLLLRRDALMGLDSQIEFQFVGEIQ